MDWPDVVQQVRRMYVEDATPGRSVHLIERAERDEWRWPADRFDGAGYEPRLDDVIDITVEVDMRRGTERAVAVHLVWRNDGPELTVAQVKALLHSLPEPRGVR